jgi:hypothetical protein
VLVSGGLDEFSGRLDDLWEWDGSRWTEVTALNLSPPARYYGSMVYDAARASTLLFGGIDSQGVRLNDTHTFQYYGGVGESCHSGFDGDGDGNVGCADADCWAYCTPACLPGSTPNWPADCDTSAGVLRCGDGSCNPALESARSCPADCTNPAPVCGDFFCDAPENAGTCPGDC